MRDARQEIITRIVNNRDAVRELFERYDIASVPSYESVARAYRENGEQFLLDFYIATTPESDATGEKVQKAATWLTAIGGAISGFAGGLSAQANQESALAAQTAASQAAAEQAKAETASKRTILLIVGVVVVAMVIAGIYFMKKK